MKKIYYLTFIIILLIILPVMSFADSIYLKDDSVYNGDIYDITDDKVFISTLQGDKDFRLSVVVKIIVDQNIPDYNIPDVSDVELRERILQKLQNLDDNPNYKIDIVGLEEAVDSLNQYEENNNIDDNNWNNNNDDYQWDDQNNNDDDYQWDDQDNNDDYDYYPPYPTKKRLIDTLSIGYINTFDFFYRFSPPFYGFGLGIRLNSTDMPVEFLFKYNGSGNVLMEYESVGTVFVSIWNMFSLGLNYRFIPGEFITPFAGVSLDAHHLVVNVSGDNNKYGVVAITINGGVEFIINRNFSILLYFKKHFSLTGDSIDDSFYYDPNFYDELFGGFKFCLAFYYNIEL